MNQHTVPDAVSAYATKARQQLFLAKLQAQIAMEEASEGAKLEDNFTAGIEREVAALYATALEHTNSQPALQAMLKDAHAYWLACIGSLFPLVAETDAHHEARLGMHSFEVDVRVNRLCLGA
jgi:hypothetical protein